MNTLAIILGAIIVILVFGYYIYQYVKSKDGNIAKSVKLSAGTPAMTVSSSKLTKPSSSNYTFATWVYVNSWNVDAYKELLTHSSTGNIGDAPYFSLIMDVSTPVLWVYVRNIGGSGESGIPGTVVQVTPNFPIQKWTYVTISVDGNYVDCYLDGKLVTSHMMATAAKSPDDDKSSSVYLGGTGSTSAVTQLKALTQQNVGTTYGPAKSDTYLSVVTYLPNPTNPQDVWQKYMSTMSAAAASLSSTYNLKMSLLTNGQIASEFNFF
jgi:hypothetical protein